MKKVSISLIFTVLFLPIAALMISCGGDGHGDGGGSSDGGPYTVGVTVTGLCGSGLVLQNNGGDDLSIPADGTYTFATALPDGANYDVTVKTQPTCQACTVSNGSGTISGANVTDITVTTPGFDVVIIADSIDADTTWEGHTVYVIEDWDFWVDATLTIEPCAIIKFNPDKGRNIKIDGNVIANGTADKPIIFTSYKDDTHGCDTNGDGNVSIPAPGNWNSVYIQEDGSEFSYCEFYYGGDTDGGLSSLEIFQASTKVTNCTFAHNSSYGGEGASARAALDTAEANHGTQIAGNVFYDNQRPMLINTTFNIDDSNVFHNSANGSETNTYNGIFVNNSMDADIDITWGETEVPFVIESWDFWVIPTLTIEPGVIIKFNPDEGRGISVDGNIIANGTLDKPIIFTSYKDDAHGCDTNGNGNASTPAPGDWNGVYIQEDGSQFSYCEFYYGGDIDGGVSSLEIFQASTEVTNCTFAHNSSYEGEGAEARAALDARGATPGTQITGNVFYDNQRPMIISTLFNIDDSNVFHNPADSSEINTYNGIFIRWPYSIDNYFDITWGETEVPFVIDNNGFYIDEFGSLTLADNVIIKFTEDSELTYYGNNLNNHDSTGVYFTSYKDDSHGGDTNGDGPSSGADGDWSGIYNDADSAGYFETWSNILYDSQ